MSAALRAAFDAWLMTTYAKCWRAPKTMPDGDPYLPKVRVALKDNGELAGPPKLVNPPSDPAWKPHAEAALKAVKGCDPLHVPDKYAEYYPAWKSKTVYFDPAQN
jgi:colicin import membrane protein